MTKMWLHLAACLRREEMTMIWHAMTYFDFRVYTWQLLINFDLSKTWLHLTKCLITLKNVCFWLSLTIADYFWLFMTFRSKFLTSRWLYTTLNSCCNISKASSWLCNDTTHKQFVLSKIWLHLTKCLIREEMTMMWHTMT